MKPVTRSVAFCALSCTASLAGAPTPEGGLATDEDQGDQYGWAVDYETAGTAGQRTLETNTAPAARAAGGTGNVQLPPEILLDRHLLRAERFLADGLRRNAAAPKRHAAAPSGGPPVTCFGTARRVPRWWCCRGAFWRWGYQMPRHFERTALVQFLMDPTARGCGTSATAASPAPANRLTRRVVQAMIKPGGGGRPPRTTWTAHRESCTS